MSPTPTTIESALRAAQDPAKLIEAQPQEPCTRDRFDSKLSNTELERFLSLVQRANAMRYQAQRQTARAVAALAGAKNLRWSRLVGATRGDAPRKPRVMLWAEVNERNTLEVLCSPELDPDDETTTPYSNAFCQTDYVQFGHLWPEYGARGNVILRFLEREYLISVPLNEFGYARTAEGFLQDALMDSMSFLLEALSSVCDVAVGSWPAYSKTGDLELISAAARASAAVQEELSRQKSWQNSLEAVVAGQIALLGLASLAEFEELRARAALENVKVTSLIFSKTGKKCSSLTTNKLVEHVAALQTHADAQVELTQVLAGLARR